MVFQGRSVRHRNSTPGISVSSAGTQLQRSGRDHRSARQIHIPQGQLTRTHLGDLGSTCSLGACCIVESQVGRSIHNVKNAVGIILPENSAAGVGSRTQIPQRSTLNGEVTGANGTAVQDFQNPTPHPGSARIRSNSSHSHRSRPVLIYRAHVATPLIQIARDQQIHVLRTIRHSEVCLGVDRQRRVGGDLADHCLVARRKHINVDGGSGVISPAQLQLAPGHVEGKGAPTHEVVIQISSAYRSTVDVENVHRGISIPTEGVCAGVVQSRPAVYRHRPTDRSLAGCVSAQGQRPCIDSGSAGVAHPISAEGQIGRTLFHQTDGSRGPIPEVTREGRIGCLIDRKNGVSETSLALRVLDHRLRGPSSNLQIPNRLVVAHQVEKGVAGSDIESKRDIRPQLVRRTGMKDTSPVDADRTGRAYVESRSGSIGQRKSPHRFIRGGTAGDDGRAGVVLAGGYGEFTGTGLGHSTGRVNYAAVARGRVVSARGQPTRSQADVPRTGQGPNRLCPAQIHRAPARDRHRRGIGQHVGRCRHQFSGIHIHRRPTRPTAPVQGQRARPVLVHALISRPTRRVQGQVGRCTGDIDIGILA